MRRFGRLWVAALIGSLLLVPLLAGSAFAATTTYYGVTGTFSGRTVLWSGSMPAGSTLQANIAGGISRGPDWAEAYWYCEPYHMQMSADIIKSSVFIVNTGTSPYARVGPFDWYSSCSYIITRPTSDSQTYTVTTSEYTYTPPPPGYVQPPIPSSGPNGTAIPTLGYTTPSPRVSGSPAPSQCLSTPGPSEYGPGGTYNPCPVPSPTPTAPPSQSISCQSGSWDWNGGGTDCKNGSGVVQTLAFVSGHRYRTTFAWSVTGGNPINDMRARVDPSSDSRGCGNTQAGIGAMVWVSPGTISCSWDPINSHANSGTAVADDSRNVATYSNSAARVSWHFDKSSWDGPIGYLTITMEDLGCPACPTASPGPTGTPGPSASPFLRTCAPNELCGSDGHPAASGTPGGGSGGTGTGSGSGTGENGLGNGNGLGPNTRFCASTGHPVGPISGECKAFMIDYWTVGVCQPITDPVTAIGWVGCVLTQILQALPNSFLYLINSCIDLVEPGVRLGASFEAFRTDITGRVPFCYLAPVVSQFTSFLASPSDGGHAFPVSMTFPAVAGVGGGTFTLPDFSSAMPAWARTGLGGLIYIAGGLMLLRKLKGGLGSGGDGEG